MRRVCLAMTMLVTLLAGGCDSDTGCKDDYDCDGALVCKVASGQCEAFVCDSADDCATDQTCDDNTCR